MLSRTTLIIVVVCAAFVGFAAVYFLVRILRARRRRPAPLPPVQPLAHRRASKNEGYDTPLLGSSPSPSRPPSSIPDDLSLLSPDLRLAPPPLPSFPSSADSSYSAESNSPTRASPRRPLSSVSAGSSPVASLSHRTSRSTLRGAPHSPHSQVQIILPAPLAPALHSRSLRTSNSLRYEGDNWDRLSLVDTWVPVARADDSDNPNTSSSIPRTSSRPSSFVSTSPSSYSHHASSSSPPPPVPRLLHSVYEHVHPPGDPRTHASQQ